MGQTAFAAKNRILGVAVMVLTTVWQMSVSQSAFATQKTVTKHQQIEGLGFAPGNRSIQSKEVGIRPQNGISRSSYVNRVPIETERSFVHVPSLHGQGRLPVLSNNPISYIANQLLMRTVVFATSAESPESDPATINHACGEILQLANKSYGA